MRDRIPKNALSNGRRLSDRVRSLTDFGLPAFLQELSGVIVALIAQDGQVLAANRDFLRLVPLPTTGDRVWNARTLFLSPRFEDFQSLNPYHGETLLLYRGMLRLGYEAQSIHALQGHLYRWQQARLLVAAEQDVEGLEKLGTVVLRLSKEIAEIQRRLLQPQYDWKRNTTLIRELMNTDPLTGVGNQRRLDESLAIEIELSRRHDQSFCLLIADLDHFKAVNDRYGQAIGNEALKGFAALLHEYSRQNDQVARSSGEEFVVLLPDTVLESAVSYAERIRRRLEQQSLASQVGRITASFGVAMLAAGEEGGELRRRATQALSRSKKEGRNRVTQAIAPGQIAAPNVSSC